MLSSCFMNVTKGSAPYEKSGKRYSRQALPNMPFRAPSLASSSVSATHMSRTILHLLRDGRSLPAVLAPSSTASQCPATYTALRPRLMGMYPFSPAIFSVSDEGLAPATPIGGCGFWNGFRKDFRFA